MQTAQSRPLFKRAGFFLFIAVPLLTAVFSSHAATNAAPTANGQSLVTNEDVAISTITLTGSDPENSPLTYTITRNPTKGALSGSGSRYSYTPTANINGSDYFTFIVNDGSKNSATATVSITISAVNDAPTIEVSAVSFPEDKTSLIRPKRKDIDGDTTTNKIISNPVHGTAVVNGDLINYTPSANYNGTDTFLIAANDGKVDSASVPVSITVTAINDAPTATAQNVNVKEDTVTAVPLSVNDVDGDALTVTFGFLGSHMSLTSSGSTVTITPNAEYSGTDSFTYRVKDASAYSDAVTVSVTILATNDAPVASDV